LELVQTAPPATASPTTCRSRAATARIQSGEESGNNLFAAYYNRGFAHYDKGEYDLAIADYETAIGLKPATRTRSSGAASPIITRNNTTRPCRISAAQSNSSPIPPKPITAGPRLMPRWKNTILRSRLRSRDPTQAGFMPKAYYNRGGANYAKHAFKQAVGDFDQFIRLRPWVADGFQARGYVRNALGERESAISDFDRAIRLDPRASGSFYGRGLVRITKEQYDTAISDLRSAIRIKPIMPRHFAGEATLTTARHECGSLDELQSSDQAQVDTQRFRQSPYVYLKLGQYRQALAGPRPRRFASSRSRRKAFHYRVSSTAQYRTI